ncbi:MAG: discoidin domain-containing protein [Alphaproteobacteria bacterium]
MALGGRTEGQLAFTAPGTPGSYELRTYESETVGAELASIGFVVLAPEPEPEPVPEPLEVVLSTEHEVYRPGDEIVASVSGLPGNAEDMLTLVPAGEPDDAYREWFYSEGVAAGEFRFLAPEPGDYEIRVLLAGTFNAVAARLPVRVEGPLAPPAPQGVPGLSLAQSVYAAGEPMLVGFAAPADYPDQAWIGLMPAEVPHGSEAVNEGARIEWQFIGTERTGQLGFVAPSTPGRYDFRLHDGDQPGALEVVSVAFTVTEDGAPAAASDAAEPEALIDPGRLVNVAAAPHGARVVGADRAGLMNDGESTVYDGAEGFAYVWLGTPIIVDLGRPYAVEQLRFLLWDRDDRFYRYRIDGSADGTGWTVLADRTDGEHRGWQEIALSPAPLRYIRLVGTHNSVIAEFQVVEFEALARDPVAFVALAEPVGEDAVPLSRDLAFAIQGGSVDLVTSTAPDAGGADALIDGSTGGPGWAAATAVLPQSIEISFNGGRQALVEGLAVAAMARDGATRPRLVEVEVAGSDPAQPWRSLGRVGLFDRGGWQRLPLEPQMAGRVRLTMLEAYDPTLPVALDEIAVLEGAGPGYASILPGQYEGFAGGPNIAAAALGGRIERASPSQEGYPADALIDGQLAVGGASGWFTADATMPQEVVVSFRDGRSARIAAVALNPDAGIGGEAGLATIVRTFEIWVSDTAAAADFTRVGSFYMDARMGWRIFAFEPVQARYVMLRVLSNHGGAQTSLGEFEVLEAVASDYRSILADDPPNLAAAALGGHYAVPHGVNRPALLDGEATGAAWNAEGGAQPPIDLVLAFREQRIATIDRITITPPAGLDPADRAREIKVSVSVSSPIDGFVTVGTYAIAPDPEPQSFSFPPVEARFVQLRILANGGGTGFGIAEVAVGEHLPQGALSALSRLPGDETGPAPLADAPSLPGEPEPNDSLADATPIAPGETREGLIDPPDDVDVYRLDTRAEPHPGITVSVSESPTLRIGLELLDGAGRPIAQQPLYERAGDSATLSWSVPQGEYFLRVSRPETSIVVQSDLSPSTDNVRASITSALNAFVGQTTEFERVSVAGFCYDIFRATDFTSDPAVLRAAVDEVNYGCGGTALYDAMHASLDWLAGEVGGKAVLVITDAEDSGAHDRQLHDLWARLGDAGVRIYGIGYGDAIHYQIANGDLGSSGGDLLRAWAAATGGGYFEAPSGEAINQVTARIAEELRRPSLYRLSVTTPRGEGGLSVVELGESIAGIAAPSRVALIFDASGSMWGRDAAGTAKIEIARQVMRAVIGGMPEHVQVGLRVYGHRYPRDPKERSCTDSELVVPFGPLDRERLAGAIDALNPQGQTPIGLSLASLRDDFAGVDGPKVVILVTDGIETCDPDPGDPNHPPDVVRALLAEGLDIKVNVVGFDIGDGATRDFLRQISDLSGGQYFEAEDARQLQAALEDAIRAGFDVLDARGEVIVSGLVNDAPLAVVEGAYRVAVAADPPILVEVAIAIDQETLVLLDKEGSEVGVETETRAFDPTAVPEPPAEPAAAEPTVPEPVEPLAGPAQIAELQRLLAAQGYDPGPADGRIGPATARAIRDYQAAAGLPATGEADVALLDRLRAPLAAEDEPAAPTTAADDPGSVLPPVIEPGSIASPDATAPETAVAGVQYFDTPRTMYGGNASSRVRSGPGTGYEQVAAIPQGGQVTVLGESAGWYYLETASGLRGFTAASLLSPNRPAAPTGRPETGPPTGPASQPGCPSGQTLIEIGPGRFICAVLQ